MKTNDLEARVLAAALYQEHYAADVALLPDTLFWDRKHRLLHKTIKECNEAGQLTREQILDRFVIDNEQEEEFAMSMRALVPSVSKLVAQIDEWIRLLRDSYLKRRITEMCGEAVAACKTKTGAHEVMSMIRARVDELALFDPLDAQALSFGEAVADLLIQNESPEERFISPTFNDQLDQALGGYRSGNLITFAARPGMGKTAFSLNLFSEAVVRPDHPGACYISLEQPLDEIVERLIAMNSSLSHDQISKRAVSRDQWEEVRVMAEKSNKNAVICATSELSGLNDLDLLIFRLKERGIRLFFIDQTSFLAHRTMDNIAGMNERMAYELVMAHLKKVAMKHKVCIVALHQLSREGEGDEKPSMKSLKGSGAFEEKSDVLLFLYFKEKPSEQDPDPPRLIEVVKNRHGKANEARTYDFESERMRFVRSLGEKKGKGSKAKSKPQSAAPPSPFDHFSDQELF